MKRSPSCHQLLNKFPAFYGTQIFTTAFTRATYQTDQFCPHFLTPLSSDSKLTVYKTMLRPIWTYGIELWGCSKPSNNKILQTFQSKMLRMISSAPWYVSNQTLHNDFDIPYVRAVIRSNTNKYKNRSTVHSNQLIRTLFNSSVNRRLKRLWPEDLAQ